MQHSESLANHKRRKSHINVLKLQQQNQLRKDQREIKGHVKLDYDNKTNITSGVLIKKLIENVENGPFKHFPIKLYLFAEM